MKSNWLDVLRSECEPPSSQRQVAKELGVSPAQISLALKGKYAGDIERLEQLVLGRYMKQVVNCPVLGEISIDKCIWHQEREFAATNPQRVMLYKACRSGCPNSKLEATISVRDKNTLRDEMLIKPKEHDEKVIYCKPVREKSSVPKVGDNETLNLYDTNVQLDYIKRAASGDNSKCCQLLEKELIKLSAKYNQLLWAAKYKK